MYYFKQAKQNINHQKTLKRREELNKINLNNNIVPLQQFSSSHPENNVAFVIILLHIACHGTCDITSRIEREKKVRGEWELEKKRKNLLHDAHLTWHGLILFFSLNIYKYIHSQDYHICFSSCNTNRET